MAAGSAQSRCHTAPETKPAATRCLRALLLATIMAPAFGQLAWKSSQAAFRGESYIRNALQKNLAMAVEWRQFRAGSPRHIRIGNAKFHDVVQPAFLCAAEVVDFQSLPGERHVSLVSATINRQQVTRMVQRLHDRLCQQPELLDRPWHFHARQVRWIDPEHDLPACDLDVRVRNESGQATAKLRLALSCTPSDQAVVAELRRGKKNGRHVSEIDVQATAAPLPGSLLRSGRMWESALLPDSCFHGNCWIDERDGQWDYDAVGTISPLDLAPLCRAALRQEVTGVAQAHIAQAWFREDALRQLDCIVVAERGRISGRALEAIASQLGVRVAREVQELAHWQERSYPFDHLLFRISANPACVRVTSTDPESPVILSHGDEPLLEVCDPPGAGSLALVEQLFSTLQSQRSIPRIGRAN